MRADGSNIYRLSSLLQRQQHSQLNQTWAHARCTLLRLVQTAIASAVFTTPPTPKTDAFFATDSALGAAIPGGLYKHQSKVLILKSSVSFCLNHFSTTNTYQHDF